MYIVVSAPTDREQKWAEVIRTQLPDATVDVYPDLTADPDRYEFAVAWKPPEGVLAGFANLRAVFNLGAGVDAILSDPNIPDHLPIVRLIDRGLTRDMTTFVAHWVIHFHRSIDVFAAQQAAGVWRPKGYKDPEQTTVGFLGFGELGSDAGKALYALGFDVAGYSRTEKPAPKGMHLYSGDDGLDEFLATTNFLVCLLPLNDATRGILNADLFAKLPKGAVVINVARGGHLVVEDLIAALDNDHLAAAVLDVFEPEPIPDGHAIWSHPKVHITPHVASLTYPRTAAITIAENIMRMAKGEDPIGIVDRTRNY